MQVWNHQDASLLILCPDALLPHWKRDALCFGETRRAALRYINIREVSLAQWGVLKCTRGHCSWLPWTLTNHATQNFSFLLNVGWLVTPEKTGRSTLTLHLSLLSLSFNIIFTSHNSHYWSNQYQLLPSLGNIYCSTLW